MMNLRRMKNHYCGVGLILLALLAFMGCGSTHQPGERVPLPESGRIHQCTRDDRVQLDYAVTRQGDAAEISGSVKVNLLYQAVDRFVLYVETVDSDGGVLNRHTLVTQSRQPGAGGFRFEKTIPLPPDATALTFGYYGKTMGTVEDPPEALMGVFPAGDISTQSSQ